MGTASVATGTSGKDMLTLQPVSRRAELSRASTARDERFIEQSLHALGAFCPGAFVDISRLWGVSDSPFREGCVTDWGIG
jgi:hypothetical protein